MANNFKNYIMKYRGEIEQKILSEVGKHPGLTHEELAKRIKLDRKTLRNHTKRLIEAGRLVGAGRTNGRNGNNYQINNALFVKNISKS
jgi:predicted transcriptional regulator